VAYAEVGASCDRSTTENGSWDGRSLNLVISNVPGTKQTRYLNGARLLGIYPVSALAASIGLNATLSSYNDHIEVGFVANAAAIDDPSSLSGHTLPGL